MRCIAVSALVVLVACTAGSPPSRDPETLPPAGTSLAVLSPAVRRPLQPLALAPGERCPADAGRPAGSVAGAQGLPPNTAYTAYGQGPVLPAFVGPRERAALSFGQLPKEDGNGFEKVIWLVAPSVTGPILVRATATDGKRARFMSGEELILPGPGTHPLGYVYFPKPGCYVFQLDNAQQGLRVVVEIGD